MIPSTNLPANLARAHAAPKTLRAPGAVAGGAVVTAPAVPAAPEPGAVSFTIPGAPMGKPRMTQRDKWKKRPCVVRYRAWADQARAAAPRNLPADPFSVSWVAYLPIPKSWPWGLKETMKGRIHRQKPDRDNLDKGLLDALWEDDSMIACGSLEKRWDDGNGPRIEVTVNAP